MTLEMNTFRKTGKSIHVWKSNKTLLNNYQGQEEI